MKILADSNMFIDFWRNPTQNVIDVFTKEDVAARTKAADIAPIFEQMLKNAGITPNVMPPLVEYHEREADGQVYGFYLNLSDKENCIADVKGFDLVTQTAVDGTLTLKGYGVAVVKKF